jgi:hypothetical protein
MILPSREKKSYMQYDHIKNVSNLIVQEINLSRERRIAFCVLKQAFSPFCVTAQKQCNTYVDTYGKAIIELLSHDIDPKEICKMLSLCDPV